MDLICMSLKRRKCELKLEVKLEIGTCQSVTYMSVTDVYENLTDVCILSVQYSKYLCINPLYLFV